MLPHKIHIRQPISATQKVDSVAQMISDMTIGEIVSDFCRLSLADISVFAKQLPCGGGTDAGKLLLIRSCPKVLVGRAYANVSRRNGGE